MQVRRVLTDFSSLFFILTMTFQTMTAQGDSQTPSKPRARDLGIPFEGAPGSLNAITDVKGVEVGHTTLISGEGKLQVGVGPVRTGVMAIHPRGKSSNDRVFAGWVSLTGNGVATGEIWVVESGSLEGPAVLATA